MAFTLAVLSTAGWGKVVFWVAATVLTAASAWRVFEKAGEPGWAALVPLYNVGVLCRIVGRPFWWMWLMLIPLANVILLLIVLIELARAFGKSDMFGRALLFFFFIAWPILAFGDAQFQRGTDAQAGEGAGGGTSLAATSNEASGTTDELTRWKKLLALSSDRGSPQPIDVIATYRPLDDSPMWMRVSNGGRAYNHAVHDAPSKEFAAEFGVKQWLNAFGFRLDHERATEMIDWIETRAARDRFVLDSVRLTERWDPKWSADAWYVLNPKHDFNENMDSLDGVPSKVHAMDGPRTLVSEEFVRFVREQAWSGVEFVPVSSQSVFEHRRWFRAVATVPLGRGVDHEYVDGDAIFASPPTWYVDAEESRWARRRGVSQAPLSQLSMKARSDMLGLNRLAALAPPKQDRLESLRFIGPPLLLRRAVPRTDFAYAWFGLDRRPDVDGPADAWSAPARPVCVSRKVRDALVKAKLVAAAEFESMRVLDEVPKGNLDLDAVCGPPPQPSFSKAVLDELVKAADREASRPLLKRLNTVEDVRAFAAPILASANANSFGIDLSLDDQGLRHAKIRLPRTWIELLDRVPKKVWVESTGFEFEAFDVPDILRARKDRPPTESLDDESLRGLAGFVEFADTTAGDSYYFATGDRTMPRDCRVVLVDHENSTPKRFWDNVPQFVQELLVWAEREMEEGHKDR